MRRGWEEERGSESEREIQFTWASAWRRFDQAANERRPLALNRRSPDLRKLHFLLNIMFLFSYEGIMLKYFRIIIIKLIIDEIILLVFL